MARLSLTKASLTKQKSLLKTFGDVLPSLDLKRRQLSAEREKARRSLQQAQEKAAKLEPEIARNIPMLANDSIDLHNLVRLSHIDLTEENLLGTHLPKVGAVSIEVRDYGLLTKPFWVDQLVGMLKIALETQIQIQVAQRRLELLTDAERKVTQRFNLFDQVLIPRTKGNIKKISIYLSDAERAGVVNSKLAKKKKEKQEEENARISAEGMLP
jgi:V/A-type H+-transporting ATPase subunit D